MGGGRRSKKERTKREAGRRGRGASPHPIQAGLVLTNIYIDKCRQTIKLLKITS
jgi:hypothetical protein